MLQELIKRVTRKKNLGITTFVLITSVVASGGVYFNTLESIKTSSLLTTGVNTCFQRISQTFTSLMIADKSSAYIEDSFTSLTGDCFAEVTSVFQASYLNSDTGLKKNLNELSNDAHWFQRRAKNLRRLNTANEYSEEDAWYSGEKYLGDADELAVKKFNALESIKDKILDTVEFNQARLESYTDFLLSLVGVSSLFLLGIAYFAYRRYQESFSFILGFEKWAGDLLQAGNYYDSYKIEQLIGAICDKLGLLKTKELFFLYHETLLERLSTRSYSEANTSLEQIAPSENHEVIELFEESEDRQALNASIIFGDVIDLIGEKAFTHGIIMDLEVDDNLYVWGKEELLQQIFYNTLMSAIEHSTKHNKGRKITIRSKPLGGTAYIKVIVNGHKFDAKEIGYIAGRESSIGDINLQLTSELLKDIDGKVVLRNLFDAEGELSGSSTEILLNRAKPTRATIIRENTEIAEREDQTKPRLVQLKKGSKKEILKEFRANQ